MSSNILVRDMMESDTEFIADYWLNSDPEFLVSMGVDLEKLPPREGLINILKGHVNTPDKEKNSLAQILLIDGKPCGHCNINEIEFGVSAKMHLHIWYAENRRAGVGSQMVRNAIPVFFERLKIKTLWCEPSANNQAPNKTLLKLGFEFVKSHMVVPGSLCFKQEANLYKLSQARFRDLY
ncbi:MAG: GNAT family N-acetyltransferase [Bacteroidia bacterium]